MHSAYLEKCKKDAKEAGNTFVDIWNPENNEGGGRRRSSRDGQDGGKKKTQKERDKEREDEKNREWDFCMTWIVNGGNKQNTMALGFVFPHKCDRCMANLHHC